MIKIIKADEQIKVEQLIVTIYSPPGLGKTTLGFSSNNPLLIDFDKGAYRSAKRGDSVQVETWGDVTDITKEDLAGYKTAIIDTAGRALDVLTTDIIRRNPKMGRGGALTLQGYGALKTEFTAWLKMLKNTGLDVVLLAHSTEEKSGDDILERLDVQGGSKGEIYKSADAMGRLSLINGKRVLNFSPTDTAYGKNPGQLTPLNVPDIATDDNFLGGVISTIKEKLNAITDEQMKRQEVISQWLETIKAAETCDQFNTLIDDVKSIDNSGVYKIVGRVLNDTAIAAGLTFDKKKKQYVKEEAA